MNAQENVAFPMQFTGTSIVERREKSYKLLEQIGLIDCSHHRHSELSGGQQQRIAVARSLVNNPSLILAGEPTGNLDTVSGIAVMKLLFDLHRSGRTVLVVTHDPRMARFAMHKFFLLDDHVVSEDEYKSATLDMAQAVHE